MNIRKHISSSCKRLLLEAKYRSSLSENTELKNVWMKKFKDVVSKENPEVVSQKGFWDAASFLYSKGIPAVSAAEKMFSQPVIGNPSITDKPQGTGGWSHK